MYKYGGFRDCSDLFETTFFKSKVVRRWTIYYKIMYLQVLVQYRTQYLRYKFYEYKINVV